MLVLVICKNGGDLIKIKAARVMTRFFLCKVNGSYVLPWQPEFHSDQSEIIMQPFPLPDDASCEIRSRLANWLQRYTLLKVWTTDDDGRRIMPY